MVHSRAAPALRVHFCSSSASTFTLAEIHAASAEVNPEGDSRHAAFGQSRIWMRFVLHGRDAPLCLLIPSIPATLPPSPRPSQLAAIQERLRRPELPEKLQRLVPVLKVCKSRSNGVALDAEGVKAKGKRLSSLSLRQLASLLIDYSIGFITTTVNSHLYSSTGIDTRHPRHPSLTATPFARTRLSHFHSTSSSSPLLCTSSQLTRAARLSPLCSRATQRQ